MTIPAAALAAVLNSTTQITRRVDIYEEDGTTPWLLDAPVLSGSIGVDSSRDEWRELDVTLDNISGALANYPGGFWYDKVIKVFRGVEYLEGGALLTWESQLGEFIIDDITTQHFPHTTTVKGRDFAAKLIGDEFGATTTFTQGTFLVAVIRAIATNGGITKMILPESGQTLSKDFSFEPKTSRWQAMTDLALAYGYQVHFDPNGYLVMFEFRDPVSSPLVFTFRTGGGGSLATYKKRASQPRLYNAVAVTGEAANQVPVYAIVENHDPSSPSSIENLGRRKTYEISSPFVSTYEQAYALGLSFLPVVGLESFDLSMTSTVMFWLDAGEIVEFVDPNPSPGDPTRFLLSDFTIPLSLEPMTANAKRVQVAV